MSLCVVIALLAPALSAKPAADVAAVPVATGAAKHTIVAVGDIACEPGRPRTATACRQADVAKRVTRLSPAALLLLGDIQYAAGGIEDYRASFGKSWAGLRGYWRPVPGNHEYVTPSAAGYYEFFGTRAADPKRGYYSFNVSGWHVVALNSNCEIVSCASGSAQQKWLRADLSKNRTKCVAAFWHHPKFSSGMHGNYSATKPLWSQLRRAGTDVLLTGHEHHYERFALQDENGKRDAKRGIRQFIVGTGGQGVRAVGPRVPNSQAVIDDKFGALSLELGATGYKWKFITEAGGTLDHGTTRCH